MLAVSAKSIGEMRVHVTTHRLVTTVVGLHVTATVDLLFLGLLFWNRDLPVYLSVCLSVYRSVHLSVCLSALTGLRGLCKRSDMKLNHHY
jgi:hypothetical protein